MRCRVRKASREQQSQISRPGLSLSLDYRASSARQVRLESTNGRSLVGRDQAGSGSISFASSFLGLLTRLLTGYATMPSEGGGAMMSATSSCSGSSQR